MSKDNLKLLKMAVLQALGALVYIAGVASLMYNGEKLFGQGTNILQPIAILLLLVLSAAVMGLLIFGRPVILYLDGRKKDALKFLGYTVGSLFLITIIFLAVIMALPK